jgi:hypothetical protein
LTERIRPISRLEDHVGTGTIARHFKLYALQCYVAEHNQLPPDCDWLYRDSQPGTGEDSELPLLLAFFKLPRTDWKWIAASVNAIPTAGLYALFVGVMNTFVDSPQKRSLLRAIAARTDFDVVAFIGAWKPYLVPRKAELQHSLADSVRRMVFQLHRDIQLFPQRLKTIAPLAPWLKEDDEAHVRLMAWIGIQGVMENEHQRMLSPDHRRPSRRLGRFEFVKNLCELARETLSDEELFLPPEEKEQVYAHRQQILCLLAEQWRVESNLPHSFGELLREYFDKGPYFFDWSRWIQHRQR